MEKGQQKMSEDKFIPISKQSKRNKKKFHASKRRTWGSINPVTKKPPNPKAYNRRKNLNNEISILKDDDLVT